MIRSGLGTPIQGPCKNMQEALAIYHYGGNVLYLAGYFMLKGERILLFSYCRLLFFRGQLKHWNHVIGE